MKVADVEGDVLLIAGGVALVAVFLIWRTGIKGSANAVVSSAVSAVGDAAVGTVTGVADGVSNVVGIPTTSQTLTDPAQARWAIDAVGYWEASFWCGVPALFKATMMDAGTGTQPPANSPFMLAHPGATVAVKAAAPAPAEDPYPIDYSGVLW